MGISFHLILKGIIYENTITILHHALRARHWRDRPDSCSRVPLRRIFSNGSGIASVKHNGIADSNGDGLTRGNPCARCHSLPSGRHEQRSSEQDRKEDPKTPEGFGW